MKTLKQKFGNAIFAALESRHMYRLIERTASATDSFLRWLDK